MWSGDGRYQEQLVRSGLFGDGLIRARRIRKENERRRMRVGADFAGEWKYDDSVRMYVTTKRIALQSVKTWIDLWYRDIRVIDSDSVGVIVQAVDRRPIRLLFGPADYWQVMLRKPAFGQL